MPRVSGWRRWISGRRNWDNNGNAPIAGSPNAAPARRAQRRRRSGAGDLRRADLRDSSHPRHGPVARLLPRPRTWAGRPRCTARCIPPGATWCQGNAAGWAGCAASTSGWCAAAWTATARRGRTPCSTTTAIRSPSSSTCTATTVHPDRQHAGALRVGDRRPGAGGAAGHRPRRRERPVPSAAGTADHHFGDPRARRLVARRESPSPTR